MGSTRSADVKLGVTTSSDVEYQVSDLDYYRLAAAQAEVARLEELERRLRAERALTAMELETAQSKVAAALNVIIQAAEGEEFKLIAGEWAISETDRTIYRTRILPVVED